MKKLKSLCLILCMCTTAFAGSNGLSRSQAAKILNKEFAQNGRVFSIPLGRQIIFGSSNEWNFNAIKALKEAGVINFRYIEKVKHTRGNHVIVIQGLTEEGMKYFVPSESDGEIAVKLADRTVVRITGILSDAHSAHVEYEWKYTNITPFGRILTQHSRGYVSIKITEEVKKREVEFSRYDDGWRTR